MEYLLWFLFFSHSILGLNSFDTRIVNVCGKNKTWVEFDFKLENPVKLRDKISNRCAISLLNVPDGYLSKNFLNKLPKDTTKAANIKGELTKIDGNALEDFSNLKYLELSNNNLSNANFINSTKPFYRNLEYLIIYDNSLGNVSFLNTKSLALEHLDLSGNELTELPLELRDFPKLRTLTLVLNKISKIPKSLPNSYALKELYLQHNKLENLEILEKFPGAVSVALEMNNIKTLDPVGLTDSTYNVENLEMDSNDLKILEIRALRQLPHLKILTLRWNKIKELSANGNFTLPFDLTYLDLRNNKLTRIPSDFFRFTPNLETLLLSYNNIKRIASGAFAELVNLKLLDLTRNEINVFESNQLLFSDKLVELKLADNQLKFIDYIILHAQAPNLKILHIAQNKISCNHLKELINFYSSIKVELEPGVPCYSTQNVDNICCEYYEEDSEALNRIEWKLNLLTSLILASNPRILGNVTDRRN